jgi:hypothetical protein
MLPMPTAIEMRPKPLSSVAPGDRVWVESILEGEAHFTKVIAVTDFQFQVSLLRKKKRGWRPGLDDLFFKDGAGFGNASGFSARLATRPEVRRLQGEDRKENAWGSRLGRAEWHLSCLLQTVEEMRKVGRKGASKEKSPLKAALEAAIGPKVWNDLERAIRACLFIDQHGFDERFGLDEVAKRLEKLLALKEPS